MEPRDYGPFAYIPINRRPNLRWPNGARVAVWVIPNIEFFSLREPHPGRPWESAPQSAPTVRAWGERDYGNRVGIFRVMEVLTRYGIRATATVNSDIVDHHPEILEEARRLDWKFMGHNRTNTERLTGMTIDEERQLIHATLAKLELATGKRPVGWLSSGMAETWNTSLLLAEAGCLYVSDWCNDDQPYLINAGSKQVVYLPYSYEINDSPQLYYRDRSIDEFVQMVRRQFDVLYREGAESGRVMAICLHPWIIGVPHRIDGLDAALEYVCGHPDVWLATGEEIVRAYLASGATF